jgi:hypothetical protein
VLLAACGTTGKPLRQFTKGNEVAYYDFSEPGTFEEGTHAEGAVRMQIREGTYTIQALEGKSEIWYGQWGDSYDNVLVDVDARQITEGQSTTYGVACRMRGAIGQRNAAADAQLAGLAAESANNAPLLPQAEVTTEATPKVEATAEATAQAEATAEATQAATAEATAKVEATAEATPQVGGATVLNVNNGDGYLFLVEGNGRFSIMRSRGRQLTPLVNWSSSDKIKTGPARNQIRAVCLGNYLAMYVNGQFLADATDDTYARGQIGLVAAGASRLGVQVDFDNLSVSGVTPS